MIRNFYVGVDGGATKCIVRLEDEQGNLLGKAIGGPASLRFSPAQVWQTILTTLNTILRDQTLSLADPHSHFHAGMGLAGSEITTAYDAFINNQHPFQTCAVTSDAHTACLGAHNAADGAIIIAGTGVAGYQIQNNNITKVGGFGFPHDDEGGGAWIGLQAVKKTVQWLDGRGKKSTVAQAVYQRFGNDAAALTAWANSANGTSFAELAPIVIECSQQQDAAAQEILKAAANAIDTVADALQRGQQDHTAPLPCALVGGVAVYIEPYLSQKLRDRLVTVANPPEAGAIMLIRNTHGSA